MSEQLVLAGALIAAVSGVPGLILRQPCVLGERGYGQVVAVVLMVVGCGLGLAGVGVFWGRGPSAEIRYPWAIPGGEFRVGIDGLSAIFLVPVFLIPLLGSVYGLEYWPQREHLANARKLQLFYGLLPAGMALLVIARNSLLFLAGWETMALSAWFLVTTEDQDSEVCATGWIYLVAAHTSTLCLVALFTLLGGLSGSFTLEPLREGSLSRGMTSALFVLMLVGFGIKAGLMPLHVWLPSSHAIAPSHVSAMMSGVILKMGIYGILRVTSLLGRPPLEWGLVVLGLGVISGILGVAYAIGQHDLKRLLAYHSIENIGIIIMGVGLALVGRSLGQTEWIVLGLAGALLHVWNHSLFKALLFLSAGSVIHAVHTREIDHLGGLARPMPWTAGCFLVGAVAICGLPPLNGFVSEWLVYLGLFRALGIGSREGPPGTTAAGLGAAALGVAGLALIGALALACFVKVFGAVFLGTGRSGHVDHAHEAGPAIIAPMLVLAGCCLFIGLAPALLAPVLEQAIGVWAQGALRSEDSASRLNGLLSLAPLEVIGWMGLALLAGLMGVGSLYALCLRRSPLAAGPTWGCGYAAPSRRMQYTSSSFAQMLVALFGWALRPIRRRPRHLPVFPGPSRFHSEVPDVVLDRAVLPAFAIGAWLCSALHVLQQGKIQLYLLYVFLALVALLLWR